MKIKNDFVTNSSSVCYIAAIYKVLDKKVLKKYLQKEFGTIGLEIFKKYIIDQEALMEDFYMYKYDSNNPEEQKCLDGTRETFSFNSEGTSNKEIMDNIKDHKELLAINYSSGNYPDNISVEASIISQLDPKKAGVELVAKHIYVGSDNY